MTISLDHLVINSRDVERTLAFYRQLFAVELESLADYRAGKALFPVIRLSPTLIIDVFPPSMWQQPDKAPGGIGNINHFCLVLDDGAWQLAYKMAKQQGWLARDAAVVTGARGKGWSFYVDDPDGNLVEIKKY